MGKIVFFLTILVWHKVLQQSFISEGFLYFNAPFPQGSLADLLRGILGYDTLARGMMSILPSIFTDKIIFYQLLMLLTIALFNVVFYYLVYELTGKKAVALTAAIFFVVNYATSYEIFGIGDYTYFLQRIPHLLVGLLAFWLLVKGAYWQSLFLYLLAILLGQFNLFLLPMFVFFIFFSRKQKPRMAIPFVLVTFILLWLDRKYGAPLVSTAPILVEELVANIAYQLSWLVFPLKAFPWFFKFREPVIAAAIPVSLFILGAVFYLRKHQPRLKPIIYSSVLFIPIAFVINVFIRSEQIYQIYGSSRYLYIPSLTWSILLAIFLYTILGNGRWKRLLFLAFLSLWFFYNLGLIWTAMDRQQPKHEANKALLAYVKQNASQLPDNALVLLPETLGFYGADFCKRFYGQEKMIFRPIFIKWEKELPRDFDLTRLVVFDFNYDKMLIIDRTEEFRELIRANKPIENEIKNKYNYQLR